MNNLDLSRKYYNKSIDIIRSYFKGKSSENITNLKTLFKIRDLLEKSYELYPSYYNSYNLGNCYNDLCIFLNNSEKGREIREDCISKSIDYYKKAFKFKDPSKEDIDRLKILDSTLFCFQK